MTGLWALTDDTTIDYELRSTLYYIRNWNILLDLQILGRTIKVALSGRLKTTHPGRNRRGYPSSHPGVQGNPVVEPLS